MYIPKVMVKCLTLLLHNRWKGHDRTLTCNLNTAPRIKCSQRKSLQALYAFLLSLRIELILIYRWVQDMHDF
jgi:hypothetical protein